MFSSSSLTELEAELVAQAYYKSGKNPRHMAAALGVPTFDLELIKHPLVKRQIVKLAERMRRAYTLDDHLERLQEIRDQAMSDGNLRIALAAELSVGKAAGLYEKIVEPEQAGNDDLGKLTTDELKQRLARLETGAKLLPDATTIVQGEIPEDEGF